MRYLLVNPLEFLRLYTEATELVAGRMKKLNDALGESNVVEVGALLFEVSVLCWWT